MANDREERFIENLVNGQNTKQAGLNAGYASSYCEGYIYNKVKSERFQERLNRRKKQASKSSRVTPEQIIGSLAEIAFADCNDLTDANGNFDWEKARKKQATKLIKSYSRSPGKFGAKVSVQFYSRYDALCQLGRILGLEQQPRENDTDFERKKAEFQKMIEDVYNRYKDAGEEITVEQIRARIIEHQPEVSKYLM